MIKKRKFHWDKRKAFKHYLLSQDTTSLKKLLLWCSIGIIPFTIGVFILAMLCSSIDTDISTVILILGALCIPADIGFMVYSVFKFLHTINEHRCKYAELTITDDTCLLYEKYKSFVSEQGFLLSEIENIKYYTECKQIVIYAPVSHYNPDTRKKSIRQASLDNTWCFIENHFKEDLLGYFESLNFPIDYIETGCFVENRKELSDLYNARHLELVKSHEHIFVQDPQKTEEMMDQTVGSITVKGFKIIGAIISIICLFVMPILAAVFVVIMILATILNAIKKNENVKMHITPINCKVTINTYSGIFTSTYTNSNTGHTRKDLILLSHIVKIHYIFKSRKLIIYVKTGGKSIFAPVEYVVIDNIFTPDLVEFLNQNVMPVKYKRGIFSWGGLGAYGHFSDDH